MADNEPIFSSRLTGFIAVTVTVVWAVQFVADIFVSTYNPSPFVHLAMMAVVGSAVGKNFISRGGDK